MQNDHHVAWTAIRAAESILRTLEHDLKVLSGGQPNFAAESVANISLSVETLQSQPMDDVVTSLLEADGKVSALFTRDDQVQSSALMRVDWLYDLALRDLLRDE